MIKMTLVSWPEINPDHAEDLSHELEVLSRNHELYVETGRYTAEYVGFRTAGEGVPQVVVKAAAEVGVIPLFVGHNGKRGDESIVLYDFGGYPVILHGGKVYGDADEGMPELFSQVTMNPPAAVA